MAKAKKMTKNEQVNEVKVDDEWMSLSTKSGQIRYLAAQGKTTSEISKMMNIRYQHVRNVLITPLKTMNKISKAKA